MVLIEILKSLVLKGCFEFSATKKNFFFYSIYERKAEKERRLKGITNEIQIQNNDRETIKKGIE